jgi:hypothetical protein
VTKLNFIAVAIIMLITGFGFAGFGQQVDDEVQRWKELSQVQLYKSQNLDENHWVHLLLSPERMEVNGVEPTIDGGYILAGTCNLSRGQRHPFLIKLNQYGQLEWNNFLNDSRYEVFPWGIVNQMTSADDGSFALIGEFRDLFTPQSGLFMKILPSGEIESSRYYLRGSQGVKFKSIDSTNDGGFVFTGIYADLLQNQGEYGKLLVRKLSSDLSDQWHLIMDLDAIHLYKPSRIPTVTQTADNGYLVTMDTQTMREESTISSSEWPDLWLIKFSEKGDVEWQKTYGGLESEYTIQPGPHVFETPGGSIYLVGSSLSFYNQNGISTWDAWVLKLSPNGDIQWQRRYDGGSGDFIHTALMTQNNGLILGGGTHSNTGTDKEGSSFLLFQISPSGDIQWQRAYSYSEDSAEVIRTLCLTQDGGIAFAGSTGFSSDIMLMKVSETGDLNIPGCALTYPINLKAINTNIVPRDTSIKTKNIDNSFKEALFENIDVPFLQKTVCWNYVKPPMDVSLDQKFNRGLFGGEALNYVSWNPNPENSIFSVDEYRVYRKESNLGDASYELLASVPAGVYQYIDDDVLLEDKFDYMVTTVDSKGRESGWSNKATGN